MRLIDGDALWDKAYEVWGFEADAGDTGIFMDMITNAPTIDPVKHGRWINSYIDGVHHHRCPECGEYIEAIWTANFVFKYCPNCGACLEPANE